VWITVEFSAGAETGCAESAGKALAILCSANGKKRAISKATMACQLFNRPY
jgi:hypothetical protein